MVGQSLSRLGFEQHAGHREMQWPRFIGYLLASRDKYPSPDKWPVRDLAHYATIVGQHQFHGECLSGTIWKRVVERPTLPAIGPTAVLRFSRFLSSAFQLARRSSSRKCQNRDGELCPHRYLILATRRVQRSFAPTPRIRGAHPPRRGSACRACGRRVCAAQTPRAAGRRPRAAPAQC